MQLVFEQINSGGDRNFGYLLGDRRAGQAVLIDPSFTPGTFVQRATEQGLTVTHVLNTHGHPDHTNGNTEATALTAAPLTAFADSIHVEPALGLHHGDRLAIGVYELCITHAPGHCQDHLLLYEPTHRILLTGDLLFVGKVGGTSNDEDTRTEWDSLQRLLTDFPDEATVWTGHDYGTRPSSTVGIERATNPFLQCADAEAFIDLKQRWPAYKEEHGLR
jgi:glyoxylase-like metal-dependent hydrolase (beta-lactamase superfamily II)